MLKACPDELATTNRILERWAVSVGTGTPTDRWQDEARSRPTPLDDPTAIVVDQIIMRSPKRSKALIFKWYRTDLPSQAIARELRLSPNNLVVAWHVVLIHTQARFIESGYRPLLELLRFRDELAA